MILYHITDQSQWNKHESEEFYLPAAFFADGFIHCSTGEQVLAVAQRYYSDAPHLLILKIDGQLVSFPIIFENLEGGAEKFPHIYGRLEKMAILGISDFGKDTEGKFNLPNF